MSRPTPPPRQERHARQQRIINQLRAQHNARSGRGRPGAPPLGGGPGEPPTGEPPARGPRRGTRRTVLLATLIVVLLLVGAVGVYAYRVLEPVSQVTNRVVPRPNSELRYITNLCRRLGCSASAAIGSLTKPSTSIISLPELRRDRRINILLLASDDDKKYRDQGYKDPATQVMLVLSLDPLHDRASLLSIPRDLWVPVHGQGYHKIDEAHLLGGVALARQAVEENFGIVIDKYAWLGLSGFVKVIDAAGGVDVDSPFPILDDDYPNDLQSPNNPYASRRLYIPAGAQHFDGIHALQYVRSRHGTLMQDFARSLHQQQVLADLKRKLAGPQVLAKLPDLTAFLTDKVVSTDLDYNTLIALALYARDHRPQISQRLILSPPRFTANKILYVGGQEKDVVMPNWPAIRPAVAAMFRPLATGPAHGAATAHTTGLTVKKKVTVLSSVARRYEAGHKVSALRDLDAPTPHATSPVPRHAVAAAPPRYAVTQTAGSAAPVGTIFFARAGDLWVADKNGVHHLPHMSHLDNARDPAMSPNGRHVVYTRQFENHSDLIVAAADGSNPHALTHDNVSAADTKANYWAAQPSWSADGGQLLFITDRAKVLGPQSVGQYGMAVNRLDLSSGAVAAALPGGPEMWTGGDADPTWRPSVPGQFAYTHYHFDASVPSVTGQIVLSDGTVVTKAREGALQPAWSPDGRLLAYIERQNGQDLLRVTVPASPRATTFSRPVTVATGLLSHPVWSPDGRSLAVVALDGGAFVIHTLPITLTGQTIGVGASQTLDATAGIDAASTLSWTR